MTKIRQLNLWKRIKRNFTYDWKRTKGFYALKLTIFTSCVIVKATSQIRRWNERWSKISCQLECFENNHLALCVRVTLSSEFSMGTSWRNIEKAKKTQVRYGQTSLQLVRSRVKGSRYAGRMNESFVYIVVCCDWSSLTHPRMTSFILKITWVTDECVGVWRERRWNKCCTCKTHTMDSAKGRGRFEWTGSVKDLDKFFLALGYTRT